MAVAEVCRNLVCAGAEPIGITDCLNFGNPERPEVMEQFARAIDGLADACNALGVPIVSGNVSLYNETQYEGGPRAILPTPTVAAVGLLARAEDRVTQHFKRAGDVVVLLGECKPHARDLGGSEYLCQKLGALRGQAPALDLEKEASLQRLVLELARAELLASAHDVSDGGLAVALAECCTTGPSSSEDVGARIDLDVPPTAPDTTALLFGEAPSRVVVSVTRNALAELLRRAQATGVPARELGVTGGDSLSIALVPRHGEVARVGAIVVKVKEVRERRERCLEGIVGA